MAKRRPDDIANLSLWLKASDRHAGMDGFPGIGLSATKHGEVFGGSTNEWPDRSVSGYHFSNGGAAGVLPLFFHNAVNGRGVARFDGVDDWIGSGAIALSQLFGAAQGLIVVVAKVITIGSNDATIKNNNHLIGDSNDKIGIVFKSGSGGQAFAYNDDGSIDATAGLPCAAGSTHIFAWWHDNAGTLRFFVDDLRQSKGVSVASGNTALMTGTLFLATATNAAGTRFGNVDVYEMLVYSVSVGERNRLNLQLYLEEEYFGRVGAMNQARDLGSRHVNLHNAPQAYFDLAARPHFVDMEPMADLSVSHRAWPHALGQGAGIRRWERRIVRSARVSWDPRSGRVTARVRDVRQSTHLVRDTMLTLKSAEEMADGMMRSFNSGLKGRLYLRRFNAWTEDPGSGLIIKCGPDVEELDLRGSGRAAAGVNLAFNSAFASGLTNWTTSGTVALDTGDLITAPDVSGNSAKLTGTGAQLQQTVTNQNATDLRFSVWHKDDSGEPLTWSAQRSIDSLWYRDSDQTFQTTEQTNTFPVRAVPTRDVSKKMSSGGGGGGFTWLIRIKANTTAGQINHVYIVQPEQTRAAPTMPTSPIVTPSGVTAERRFQRQIFSNNAGERNLLLARGTLLVVFEPYFDAADVTGNLPPILTALYDTYDNPLDEALRLRYEGATPGWAFASIHDGTASAALASHSPIRGVPVYLALRWTSSEGELGLAANTNSLFADGVKGTDVVVGTKPTESAESYILLSDCAGSIRNLEILPWCLTDEEIARRCKPKTAVGTRAFWRLEEAAGAVRRDAIWDAHLVDVGATGVTQVAGKIGNAAHFTAASSQYLATPEADAISPTGPFTVVAWVKADSLPATNSRILSKGAGQYDLQVIRPGGAGTERFAFAIDPSVDQVLAKQFGLPATATWYLVIGWYDGQRIYIQVNNGPVDAAAARAGLVPNTKDLRVGAAGDTLANFWDGAVDAAGLIFRVLDARERADLWNGGAGKEWPF